MSPSRKKVRDLLQRDNAAIGKVMQCRFYPLAVEQAEGCKLRDLDGNEYLDFTSGGSVASTGYCHPSIVEAIRSEAGRLTHNCFVISSNPITVELAEKLKEITPGEFDKKVWFGLSGSDANETVIKLLPRVARRPKIISFMGAFHGMTMGALSMSGDRNLSKFTGLANVVKVPYAYCYRCPFKLEYPECGIHCVDFIEDYVFNTVCPPEETSCIIVEPLQSDAGNIVPPDEFLPKLSQLCKDYGLYMVVDEVKTCFGRTGKMFAVQHTGVEPDLLILGKPMASGLPLSACVGRCEILDSGFSHGFTTGANPISCAASLATIRILDKEHLVDNSARMGAHLMKRLEELKGQHEMIGDVRGKGLIAGIELVRNRNTKEPAHLETTKVCYRAWELGLIIIYLGIYANSIELTPPLVVTKEQLDTGLDILDRAFEDVERGKVSDRSLQGFDGWVR